jgi:hypothetical protein
MANPFRRLVELLREVLRDNDAPLPMIGGVPYIPSWVDQHTKAAPEDVPERSQPEENGERDDANGSGH